VRDANREADIDEIVVDRNRGLERIDELAGEVHGHTTLGFYS
jgi:hypothetical protein